MTICKHYFSYTEFDKDYGFSEKAGFQLTEKQIKDTECFVTWPASLNTYAVGGGKTVVSTVVALMRGTKTKVVTVPPVLITPWAKWLNKVSDRVLVYRGNPKERFSMNLGAAHWVVVSHAIFRQDFQRIYDTVSEDCELIVDEAHALKSSASVLFKKVQLLAGNAGKHTP